MSDSKTRRSRYRQFSWYTFLVILSLGCVWLGWEVKRANQQRQAVAWVLEMGGSVKYDYETNAYGVEIPNAKPTSPEWLRDYYHEVVHVYIHDNPVRDLTPLASLRNIQALVLSQTHVNDLTPLANLKSLKQLDLWGTQVSEEQITKLQQALPNCRIYPVVRGLPGSRGS